MPSYTYKCDGCDHVEENVVHGMFDKTPQPCPTCCAQDMRIVIQPVKTRIRYSMRDDCRQYRADLARYPGDPRAYVDGPRSLQKLLDLTQREGGTIRPLSEAAGAQPSLDDDEDDGNILREAQEEAIQSLNEEG